MIGASFSLPALAVRQRPSGRSLSFAGGVLPSRFSLSRASGATRYATPTTLATVGVDTARLETGVSGTYLLVEPEAANLVPYARPTAATWSALSSTAVTNRSAPALGYFSGITVASGGADWHRALQLLSIASGVSYRLSVFVQSGSSGRMRIVLRDTMSGAETRIIGAFGAIATSTSAAGSVTNLSETVLADGQTRLIQATFVPNFNGSVQLGIGPDSAVSGQSVDVLGVQIEAGSTAISFVDTGAGAQTRAADVPTVNGISGTYDVTATFDSGAPTVCPAQSVADGYWPAGLSGKIAKLEFE